MTAPATRRIKRREAGFTLTELLVVVTIIGVMVTMAVVYMRPRVRSIDVANRLGDLFRESSRRAVALGPVRADVVTALGSKARTRVLAVASATDVSVAFTLSRLQEGPPASGTATWVPLETYTTSINVLTDSWAAIPGDHATLQAAGKLSTDWTTFAMMCRPDGTCDQRTVFFQAAIAGPTNEQFAKIALMQLGGAITTRPDWN